jgi:hypothetical protein
VLTCQHHVQWVRQVDGGLHQCILCMRVVTKKDVYPKLEDLPEEFRLRWDAHEATRPAPAAAAAAMTKAATPTPTSTPTATSTSTATPTSTPSPTPAPSPRPPLPAAAVGEGGSVHPGS